MSGQPKREHVAAIDAESERVFELLTIGRKSVQEVAEFMGLHTSQVNRRRARAVRIHAKTQQEYGDRLERVDNENRMLRHEVGLLRREVAEIVKGMSK